MQPTIPTTRPLTSPGPARPRPRRRAALAVVAVGALSLGGLLAGCGGSSGSDADASADTTAPADVGSATDDTTADTTGDATDTTAPTDAAALDLCAEVSEEDVAAILTEATLVDVSPVDGMPTPTCRYQVEIGGGAATAPVVRIDWNEPEFFDAQRELQTSETDLTELDADAFILEEGSLMVYVRGKTGTFLITQGVELADGGQPASRDQLIAIAELVQDL